MGFFSRLLGIPEERDYLLEDEIIGDGTFAHAVVGESYYQDNLERICGPRKPEGEHRFIEATLIMDDENPHDNQAVVVKIHGLTVGHLRRDAARTYRMALRRLGYRRKVIMHCQACIRGGWQRDDNIGHYGVWLDIPPF